jgi:hypothetical protein
VKLEWTADKSILCSNVKLSRPAGGILQVGNVSADTLTELNVITISAEIANCVFLIIEKHPKN